MSCSRARASSWRQYFGQVRGRRWVIWPRRSTGRCVSTGPPSLMSLRPSGGTQTWVCALHRSACVGPARRDDAQGHPGDHDRADARGPDRRAEPVRPGERDPRGGVQAAVQRTLRRATRCAERTGAATSGVSSEALELRAAGSAGLKSRNEAAFLSMLKDLPEPLVNTKLNGEEPDFHWPEHKLVVEIDGPGHDRPRTQREDARKEAAWRAAGYERAARHGAARGAQASPRSTRATSAGGVPLTT